MSKSILLIYGLIGYIIGFIYILVIRIKQTNVLARGNSYVRENIKKHYIYDIKRSTGAGVVSLIIGLIVGVVFERLFHDSDIYKWGLLIVPIITIAVAWFVDQIISIIGMIAWAKT